ncbi:MAG TPA: hypothetical protein VIJ47_06125 [Acidimicrobiales bacterium]
MTTRRRLLVAVVIATSVVATLAGCSSPRRSTASTSSTGGSTASSDGSGTSTTTTPAADAIVFTTVDGAIDAYRSVPPYTRQRVIAAGTAPDGNEPHGQICFSPDGSRRFVVAETKPAGATPASAGWGLYQLTGDAVGGLRVRRVSGWTSPSGPAADAPTTYGCAFLADGRLLTSDLGNQRTGAPTGRLVEWFAPYDDATPTSCIVSDGLATPLGLSSDGADNVYLTSARAPTAGVWRYSGTFPADASGCVTATTGPAPPNTTTPAPDPGGSSTTTSPGPTVTHGPGPDALGPDTPATRPAPATVTATLVIPAASGPTSAPTAVAVTPDGKNLVVASAPFGAITAYGIDGTGPVPILSDPSATMVATTPFAGGTPLGVSVGLDGAVFYADPGLVAGADGVIGPADRTGTIRRVATSPGFVSPPPPETINAELRAPDGLGLYLGVNPQAGGASKA